MPISIETIADLKGDKLGEEVYDFEEERGLIYDNIIKGYSKKQWGKPNEDAVKRLRVSQTIGGSYFDDVFEGLPIGGFYKFLCNMIDHENVKAVHLNKKIIQFEQPFDAIIWTAPIDEHPSCEIDLRWNGTAFLRTHSKENFLTAVYNYNVDYVPWTRRTKMKLLTGCESEDILIEIPRADDNAKHYILEMDEFEKKYIDRFMWIEGMGNSYFCGRSATAKYLDMDEVIEQAENVVENVCSRAVLSDT